jgi:hypothetical protein
MRPKLQSKVPVGPKAPRRSAIPRRENYGPSVRGAKKEEDRPYAEEAAKETKQRLPTPTAEEEKEIQDAYARQEVEQKEIQDAYARQEVELQKPTLTDRRQAALNARAQSRFGVDATFIDAFPTLKKDMVAPIVLRYTIGYTPPNPQQCVELTLAKVTNDFHSGRHVEVELERRVCMSYQNGSRELTDFYALHSDGTIRYLDDEGCFREWAHHVPRWEFANLPMVGWTP